MRYIIILGYEGYHSAKCKVWQVNRDADVKNYDLGGRLLNGAKDVKLRMH